VATYLGFYLDFLDLNTLLCKALDMQNDWAEEHLHTIRTLMERVALYRRALAPVMFLTGGTGILFSICGQLLKVENPISFVIWWLAAGLVAFLLTLFITRRQALKDKEPFWSNPTRQVIYSLIPPLFAGISTGIAVVINVSIVNPPFLPAFWIMFYGIALYSAGFFMRRGMKLFGFLFVIAGGIMLIVLALSKITVDYKIAHLLMGIFFGVIHIGYGVYLHFTEKSVDEQ